MKKFSKYIFSGIMVSSVLFSSVFGLSNLFNNDLDKNSYAEGTEESSFVTVYNKKNEVMTADNSGTKTIGEGTESEKTYNYTSYKWQNTNYFKFNIPDLSSEFSELSTSNSFTLSINWYPTSIDSLSLEHSDSASGNIKKETNFSQDKTFSVSDLYIDNLGDFSCLSIFSQNENGNASFYESNGGWGVYKFTISTQRGEIRNTLIEIQPNKVSDIDKEATPLLIESKETRSDFSINSAFEFYIKKWVTSTDESPYLYLKKSEISWYISGEGSDGTNYVLFPSHAKVGQTPLLKTESTDIYSGKSIKFDFDISGTWGVQCVVKDGENEIKSNVVNVSTVESIDTTYIILIIVGGVIIGAIVLFIIIKVAKKRERIW